MPDSSPVQEPDDLPSLFTLPALFIDSRGVPSGPLKVITEDGRPLRITGARYLGDYCERVEITVTEEDA